MIKHDRTAHAPAVAQRPHRHTTTALVLHRFATATHPTGVEEAIRFFTRDPEGIATVALPGLYTEKLATIERWRLTGPPFVDLERARDLTEAGFVPYHFLVDAAGEVHRMLPLEARGAHAGAFNWRSVAVACLGDFRAEAPTDAQVDATIMLLQDLLEVYPGAKILSHDEVLRCLSQDPKGCVGPLFPLEEVRQRAHAAAPRSSSGA